ncbi:hypothetical protein IGI04_015762 [Brassica rapa subsp. trilocularis]|uniref:Uncharacterized protein n=1 Tax=Brassica rapa subsp. trilocularis TaxID=1813537 RepID=A0ABQ7MTJ7_BRACM|nr:hypothetical protein IGI04_015762 [Brassica rapa subsp. trilocularis]
MIVNSASFSVGNVKLVTTFPALDQFAKDHKEIKESEGRRLFTRSSLRNTFPSDKTDLCSLGYRSYQTMPFVFSGLYLPLVSCFTMKKLKGHVIQSPIGPEEYLKRLHPIDLEKLQFVGDSRF